MKYTWNSGASPARFSGAPRTPTFAGIKDCGCHKFQARGPSRSRDGGIARPPTLQIHNSIAYPTAVCIIGGMDQRYAKNAGAVFSLKYHIVWCPKYSRPVLTGP